MTNSQSIQGTTREKRAIALFKLHEDEIVRYIDGSYSVPSASRPGIIHHCSIEVECECEDWKFNHATCIHQLQAQLKDSKLRRQDRERIEEARRRALERKKDRAWYTPSQIEANLERMSS